MAQVELTVSFNTTQAKALEFARRLARDDDFRGRAARDPRQLLAEYGITIDDSNRPVHFSPIVPPKHVVEEALVNVTEASEFVELDGFESADPFAFWLFVILMAA
jgi:hypothetical protein